MDAVSQQTTQLTANDGRNENPTWAPDGAHIAYASKRGKQSQIWVMNADGTGKHSLTLDQEIMKNLFGLTPNNEILNLRFLEGGTYKNIMVESKSFVGVECCANFGSGRRL